MGTPQNFSMIKILENYITPEYEQLLLSKQPKRAISPSTHRNSISRFGSKLPYNAVVNPTIPSYYEEILKRLRDDQIIDCDSISVNEYQPGQSINWHIDSPTSGPTIVVISLKGTATMGLRKLNEKDENNYLSLSLPARSLLIMSGEERETWEHCIHPLLEHRFSVVFRKGTNVNIRPK